MKKLQQALKNSKNNNNYLSNIKYRIDSFIIKRKIKKNYNYKIYFSKSMIGRKKSA